MTEREKFIVPVRAVGARALLDFPDEVHFSAAPVKVRNNNVYIMYVLHVHAHCTV